MVSLAKLLRIMQGIGKKYKNIELKKFQLSIPKDFPKISHRIVEEMLLGLNQKRKVKRACFPMIKYDFSAQLSCIFQLNFQQIFLNKKQTKF